MIRILKEFSAAPLEAALAALEAQMLFLGYGRAETLAAMVAVRDSPRGELALPHAGGLACDDGGVVDRITLRWRGKRAKLSFTFVGRLNRPSGPTRIRNVITK